MKLLKTRYFTVIYENGALRRIMHNNVEVLRMIYSAVRDRNWNTPEPEIVAEQITRHDEGFEVQVKAVYRQGDISFEASYRIAGDKNRLVFEMNGLAKTSFLTNRTGFCILHPIRECAGSDALVIHPEGSSEIAEFPVAIAPHQPMKNIAEMVWQPSSGVKARIKFKGDIFEMEDQRNWTDASYKTYCRPLEWPFPYELKEGETVSQVIELEIMARQEREEVHGEILSFYLNKKKIFRLPVIGVCSTSRKEPVTENEARVLREFPFDHLRAEIRLYDAGWKEIWNRVVAESGLLNIQLFIVLYFTDNASQELERLLEEASSHRTRVKYILVVGENHQHSTSIFDGVFSQLHSFFPAAVIGEGVNAWFTELNRNRPDADEAGFVSFAVCPQVHATDKTSLVENLEGQRYAVESARDIFHEKPVFVSPVTLKQRFNLVATGAEHDLAWESLPPQVDVRQSRVFAAQWLLVSLKFLTQAETHLVTYFETAGWRGFIQGDYEPPVPGSFPAHKGDVFPVFRLLQQLKDFDEVVFSQSSQPLKVDGIVLRNSSTGTIRILLANFQSSDETIALSENVVIRSCSGVFHESVFQPDGPYIEVPPEEILQVEVEFTS